MSMNQKINEFIPHIIDYCESQFPKKCNVCGKLYKNFNQFVIETKPIGVMVHVKDENDVALRTLSMANCVCNTTLCIQCGDQDKKMFREFSELVLQEAEVNNTQIINVMNDIRDEVRSSLLKLVPK